MADTTISPNMNLPVPVPSTAPGPDWANDIVADMYAIDSHDHTSGKGVPITPDGIDISADLPMGSNNLTEVRSVNFTAQSAPIALAGDIGCIYVSGADLYYNDEAGNQVRITQGGSVTGSTGTITGLPSGTASASYSAGTFTFQSATSTPANMAVGPLIIGRNAASSKTVTLTPNAAQASNYGIGFPAALPGATNYTTLDASGNLSFNASGTTGTGAVVLATSPTLVTPVISGTPTGNVTGTGAVVLATSPTITTPTFTTGSTTTGTTTSGKVLVTDGTAGVPTLAFSDQTNTGMYRVASSVVGIACNGVLSQEIGGLATFFVQGTAADPSVSFLTDSDSGIYNRGTNQVGISAGGVLSSFFTSGQQGIQDGTSSAPYIAFASDSDTGIYRAGTNTLGIAAGTTAAATFSDTAATFAGSIQTASGGAFKTSIFSGTLSASAKTTLTITGTIVGTFGYSQLNTGSVWVFMDKDNTSFTSASVAFISNEGSTSTVRLVNNDTNGSNDYKVTVFYQ